MPLWKRLAQLYATLLIGFGALVPFLRWVGVEEDRAHLAWLFVVFAALGTYGQVRHHRAAVSVVSAGGARRAPWLRATQDTFGGAAAVGAMGVVWWWGVGFGEAETYGAATRSTNLRMATHFWVAVSGLVGLAVTWIVTAADARRTDRPERQPSTSTRIE